MASIGQQRKSSRRRNWLVGIGTTICVPIVVAAIANADKLAGVFKPKLPAPAATAGIADSPLQAPVAPGPTVVAEQRGITSETFAGCKKVDKGQEYGITMPANGQSVPHMVHWAGRVPTRTDAKPWLQIFSSYFGDAYMFPLMPDPLGWWEYDVGVGNPDMDKGAWFQVSLHMLTPDETARLGLKPGMAGVVKQTHWGNLPGRVCEMKVRRAAMDLPDVDYLRNPYVTVRLG